MNIIRRTDSFSTSPQISVSDVQALADQGFKTIINNRPDLESPDQPLSADIGRRAEELGINYIEYPVTLSTINTEVARKFAEILTCSPTPILAFCKSGNRSNKLFQLAKQTHSSL